MVKRGLFFNTVRRGKEGQEGMVFFFRRGKKVFFW